jgi:hypothetical protein
MNRHPDVFQFWDVQAVRAQRGPRAILRGCSKISVDSERAIGVKALVGHVVHDREQLSQFLRGFVDFVERTPKPPA